jgi:hypothetical protein
MIINKNIKCPTCGRVVESIQDFTGNFRGYCSPCHSWWYEKIDIPIYTTIKRNEGGTNERN